MQNDNFCGNESTKTNLKIFRRQVQGNFRANDSFPAERCQSRAKIQGENQLAI
jgi:hypothetical protein